jgi:hypothetical protein
MHPVYRRQPEPLRLYDVLLLVLANTTRKIKILRLGAHPRHMYYECHGARSPILKSQDYDDDDNKPVWPTWVMGDLFRGMRRPIVRWHIIFILLLGNLSSSASTA